MRAWQRRLFGVLTLGGSFTGFVVGAAFLVSPGGDWTRLLSLPFMALYVWGIANGLAVLEERPDSLRWNRYFWLMQIPSLSSPLMGYMFISGAAFHVTYAPLTSDWNYRAHLGSQFTYSLLQMNAPFVIGVNLLAIAICAYLLYLGQSSKQMGPEPAAATDLAQDSHDTP